MWSLGFFFECDQCFHRPNLDCRDESPRYAIDIFKCILRDINVLLNYIFANPSMKNGETWTPICVPGISEDFLLYVYIHYFTVNFGIIIICTDHSGEVFFEC